MKNKSLFFILALTITASENIIGAKTHEIDYLKNCWTKQVGCHVNKVLSVHYVEQLNNLYHSPEPWQTLHYNLAGSFLYAPNLFYKMDTLTGRKRMLTSATYRDKQRMILRDHGDTSAAVLTKAAFENFVFEGARYTPQPLIDYCKAHKIRAGAKPSDSLAVFFFSINQTHVELFIRKADCLAVKATTLSNDDLRGDVLTVFNYENYASDGTTFFPRRIRVDKYGGRVKDTIAIKSVSAADSVPSNPVATSIKSMVAQKGVRPSLHTNCYNSNISFIDIAPAGSKVMIVEFRDFLLVSEAPSSSRMGEMVIKEIRKSISSKPIKFFVFSHHHPDYLGGMRPLVFNGATVLCTAGDEPYIKFLHAAPHTLVPDELQKHPCSLQTQIIQDSLNITDGIYTMKVYHIGMQSGHTKDYCIFYFPKEKLLTEGDLIWIKRNGEPEKASPNQAGLYKAITERKLGVETIMQTWGASMSDYKMSIPFADLEKSVSAAQ